jgi:uncharacterized surface protein with fasciclin (FAS1) repeats
MKKLLFTTALVTALAFSTPSFATHEHETDEGQTPATAETHSGNAAETKYVPAGVSQSMSLGKMIAMRIKDSNLSEFKKAMETAEITKPYDSEIGYTVFAPINSEFDAADHPMDYYIINKRFAFDTMDSVYDSMDNIGGTSISVNKTGNKSYYIDDMRVNEVDRNPEGTIYTVGGWQDPSHL